MDNYLETEETTSGGAHCLVVVSPDLFPFSKWFETCYSSTQEFLSHKEKEA